MVTRTKLILICHDILSTYFTEPGTKATIGVMERLNLKNVNHLEEVNPDIVDICILSLFERVRMLKGDDASIKFLTDMTQNEVFSNQNSLKDLLNMAEMTSKI